MPQRQVSRRTRRLHGVLLADNRPLMELLLKHGADFNAETEVGDTPLHYGR
jgi:ankyrin repeat protein